MSYAAACPHDPIEEIRSDVFMVRGSVPLNPLMRISRNMAVLRRDGELTLVNPLRLEEAEEKRLLQLGSVTRLLRLGPLHGRDDRYYLERFQAELWAPGPSQSYPEPAPDRVVGEASELPFDDAALFCFEGAVQPEAALLLRADAGLLLTCDAIQHYGDYRHNTLLARTLMPFIGFPKTTLLGPIWLKTMTPAGSSLEGAFRRLLRLAFDDLLSAHGSLLRGGAHAAVTRAVDRAFA